MITSTTNHREFAIEVETLLTRRANNQISLEQYISERYKLTTTGLRKIAQGGHGPTWAKTLLKFYATAWFVIAGSQIAAPACAQIAPIAPPMPMMSAMQSYTVITPGLPPVFINEIPAGGFSVISPGQAPIFVTPTGDDGAYSITSPGMDPVFFFPVGE